jgi:signal transduction histidine kinase
MKTFTPAKSVIAGILLLGPLLLYVTLRLVPALDPNWANPIFHFYIVTFASLIALVVALFTLAGIGLNGARAVFAVMGFTTMAGIFVLHGLATPGVFFPNPTVTHGIGLSARLSLFSGAIFLLLAVRSTRTKWEQWIIRERRNLWVCLLIVYGIYFCVISAFPEITRAIESQTVLSAVVAATTVSLLLSASWAAWRSYLANPQRLMLVLAFATMWLATAQVSQYFSPLANLSWWMYHILMLAAFVVTMAALIVDYEHILAFRVTHYFTALSVIIGVPVIAVLSEAAVRLSGSENARWPMFGFSLLAVTLLFLVLLIIVRRAETIMNVRAAALEEQKQWRTDFTNLIVHDLKSPLSVTATSLDLMLSGRIGELSEGLRIQVERAQRGNRETLTLVENLLEIEKLEAGAVILERSVVNVGALIGNVVDSVHGLADAGNLDLATQVMSDEITVEADQSLLHRVLQNLLSNAIKFTPKNGAVRVEAAVDGDQWVRVSVIDTGPGIPQTQRRNIFNKFVQLSGTERRGVGLGLTFCKLAIEAHGGQIWVEDAPTQGSRFVFTVPAQKSSQVLV